MRKINARSIDMSQFRVENKGNIGLLGRPSTSFSIFQFDASRRAFVQVGNGFAPGYSQTDRMCVKHWLGRQAA